MPDFVNYKGENIEAGMQATSTSDGLISAVEKVKLNGIAAGANNYTHPATHPPSIIAQDANNRFMTDAEKTKLNGIATNANNYVHPTNHPASIITQDANNRFVTDVEKAAWNAKASTAVVTTTANGLMIAADKVKLNGIAAGANAYTHPATHPPSIIAQDANNRFVTDAEKTKWNNISYEYGSNANGSYKKFGDGTLEMWGIVDVSIAITNNNAAPYYSNPLSITFPINSTVACSCTAEISSAGAVWLSFVNSVDFTSNIAYRLFGAVVYNTLNGRVQWTAKGRWK